MGSFSTFVSIIANLCTIGSDLKNMFGSADTIDYAALVKMIVNEVQAVFESDLTEVQIHDAAAAQASAMQFITTDFTAAIDAGQSDSYLYNMLTSGNGANDLSTMEDQINLMAEWTSTGEVALAQQTTSLYLLLATTILGWYQEQARRSTGADQKQATETVEKRAKIYADQASTLLTTVDSARTGAVSSVQIQYRTYTGAVYRAWFTDSWGVTDGSDPPELSTYPNITGGYGDYTCTDGDVHADWLRGQYMQLLANGSTDLQSSIQSTVNGTPCFGDGTSVPNLPNLLKAAQAYGAWLTNGLASHTDVQNLETNPMGSTTAMRRSHHRHRAE
jgi:hypothetical protein